MAHVFGTFIDSITGSWNKYLQHPWMVAIHDGSLRRDQFSFFLAQDMPYQRDFLNALTIAATKSDTPDAVLQMRGFIKAEALFEEQLLNELGIAWTYDRWAAGPSREAYMNHLVRVAHEEAVPTICAALLPCAAGFTGAMADPVPKEGLDPLFVRWLEFYERPEQREFSELLVDIFESGIAGSTGDQVEHARMIFTRSIQHQIAVLDAAWRASDPWSN